MSAFDTKPFTRSSLALLLASVAIVVSSSAQAAGIRASVSAAETTLQRPIVLSVTIEGSQSGEPRLPALPAFNVSSRGTSRQVQIINGRTSSSVTHTFVLAPKKVGTFQIGPVQANIDGTVHSSKPFRLRVVAAAQASRSGPKGDEDVIVRATISDTSPYVGQQIVYTLRIYRRVRLSRAELSFADFDGFLTQELGEQTEGTTVFKGREYAVTEIRRALFPQQAGTLVIAPSSLNCDVIVQQRGRSGFPGGFGGFFGRNSSENRIIRSRSLEVKTRSLPAPPNGYSGLVGQFSLKGRLSRNTLKVGESTTLTLTVSGVGNVGQIAAPRFTVPSGFKNYDDKPTGSTQASSNAIRGTKTYRKALVPLAPTSSPLPAATLVYFDPSAGSYKTARAGPFPVSVSPGDQPEELKLTEVFGGGAGGSKVAVRVLGDDILPIYTRMNAVMTGEPMGDSSLLGLLLLPPCFFFGANIFRRRQKRESSDGDIKRRRVALRHALKAVKHAGSLQGADSARATSSCLRQYVGDKLGMEGSALTPEEAHDALTSAGVSEELTGQFVTTLRQCEAALFGNDISRGAVSAQIAESMLRKIDKEARR